MYKLQFSRYQIIENVILVENGILVNLQKHPPNRGYELQNFGIETDRTNLFRHRDFVVLIQSCSYLLSNILQRQDDVNAKT